MMVSMQKERLLQGLTGNSETEELRCIFNVMILYDELAAGQRAMQLFTSLADEHGDQFEFRPQIWRFEFIADPDWRPLVDEEALRADLFVVAMTGQTDLPAGVRAWFKTSLSAKQGAGAALVALLGKDGDLDTPASSRFHLLQQLAYENGLEFFSPTSTSIPRPDSTMLLNIFPPPNASLALAEVYAHPRGEEALPQIPRPFNKRAPNWHWGIND
jgi:hypothetical protein